MEECRVVAINNLISYISPTENPLSANVVMIQERMHYGCMMLVIIRTFLR